MGAGGGSDATWSVSVRRNDDAFTALEQEWNDLYDRCSTATPFQSYAWLESWWRAYGRPGRLRLVLVRREGLLVGAAPLMLQRRGPFAVLTSLGGDQSDFHDILLDDAGRLDACRELAKGLSSMPGRHALDIREARRGAAAERLFGCWPGSRWRTRAAAGFEIQARSVDEFLGTLPRLSAKKMRSKLRKIEASGIDAREVRAAEVADAVPTLLRLHEEQWRGRNINREHLSPRYRRHLVRAVTRMVERDQAALVQYRMGGEVVVSDLNLIGHEFVGSYLAGFQPRMREHVDVAVMMATRALGLAERSGRPVVSLLRGDESYKERYHPVPFRSQRLLLAPPGMRPSARVYARLVCARTAAADAARHRLPWLRSARNRIRQSAGRLMPQRLR
jgi:CelD/BcsL family acetyltransferase involved in cellulose biosynthesis